MEQGRLKTCATYVNDEGLLVHRASEQVDLHLQLLMRWSKTDYVLLFFSLIYSFILVYHIYIIIYIHIYIYMFFASGT